FKTLFSSQHSSTCSASIHQMMCYGDITRVSASGASEKTSQQDRLGYSGVEASEKMAQMDSGRMNKYKSKINSVGSQCGIDPALIAAIISRESRAGNALDDGWGDHGNAWGLMQVDIRYHQKEGDWDSEEHLRQATGILVHFIKRIQNKFPNWSREQQLKGGIAAYNMGDGNVHSYENLDAITTGKDYSNDVVARAKWYKRYGY
uniref:Lysozyme g n=1 Tax=Poecilia latipinna TaxID=48699 RepID=A0A3B3U1L6_9TELE